MTQLTFIDVGSTTIQMEFPEENTEVLPGVTWGDVNGFPTPAYWAYRVIERRLEKKPIQYKQGRSLLEEVGACILGGHGIPASMGKAAYEHLKSKDVFSGKPHKETQLYKWLSEPIDHLGKPAKYRFSKQKAKYLYSALEELNTNTPPLSTGKELRNWLLRIKGIGPKTASWIARNWLEADDVAILDIHIYRAGLLARFFSPELTVEKNYFELEESFLSLASALGVSASELDAVMWYEMQNSNSVHRLLKSLQNKETSQSTSHKPNERQPKPQQIALI